MDVYSTSFNVYPFSDNTQQSTNQHLLSSSTPTPVHRHHSTHSGVEAAWDSLHRLSLQTMAAYPGVQISFSRAEDSSPGAPTAAGPGSFNFHISGPYHAVMAARGCVLRDAPVQNRSVIKVARHEILESSSGTGGTAGALKALVIQRLDEIAAQTHANISVLKSSSPPTPHPHYHNRSRNNAYGSRDASSPTSANDGVWSAGLETEKMCELVITGVGETVDVARIRLLVMLDAMSGLHAEPIDIDYKLHAILAGRKRRAIHTIQEESATNIYFPPLPVTGHPRPSRGGSSATMTGSVPGINIAVGPTTIGSSPAHLSSLSPPYPNGASHHLQPLHHQYPGSMSPNNINHYSNGITQYNNSHYPHNSHQHQPHHSGTVHGYSNIPAAGSPGFPSPSGSTAPRSRNGSVSPEIVASTSIDYPGPIGHGATIHGHGHNQSAATNPHGPNGNGVPEIIGSGPEGSPDYNPNVIWITGEFFNVGRARDALYQLAAHKVRSKTIISRDTAIQPRKLDWMLTHRMDDLKTIMKDQGTYISLPALGSATSLCTIYGDSRMSIERTVKAIMGLASQFYVANFWLLPLHFNVLMPTSNSINSASIPLVLRRMSVGSGAEVVFKSNCFEIHGLETEVRQAVGMILELDIVKNFHHEIRFQLELANEYREFISGKKNGKINKIMTSANVKIKFESFNEHNFLIDISGTDAGAIHGLTLLQEELPAEISFHVPEVYHKRIIGVGGRSIQRIMKKYGVYVKFNSAEELAAACLDDEDNVLARTPAKNALNLDNLKSSVMELVNPKDKDYIVETISIPRRYHRTLFGEKSIFLRDIEAKTNSKITFPGDGLDIVTIFGPESQVHIAAAMVLDHVPFEADMPVPSHPELARVSTSPEFTSFSERIKREYQVTIIPFINDPPPSLGSVPTHSNSIFKFKCQRSNSDCLGTTREMLEAFLISNHVHVYPSPHSHKRVDSFTDAFPHFNSKLLSTPVAAESPESRPTEGLVERRIRMASSTPDVKALFNSSSHVYRVPEQDEPDEDSYYSRSSYATSSSGLNDYWNPTLTATRSGGLQHGLPPVIDEPYKRGSDSLLESKMREKLAQSAKPRSLTTRAQSLDLTSLSLTRTPNSNANIPKNKNASGTTTSISETPDRADSSTDSGTNPSPPTSAMIPSFPSVYGPSVGLGSKPPRPLGVVEPRGGLVQDMDEMFAKFSFENSAH